MVGIDNEERKAIINSFINKSKKSGIKIKYTNFTYKEISDTISNMVGNIKGSSCGKRMVSVQHYKNFLNTNSNMDFYSFYQDWCSDSRNKYNDYKAFNQYIIKLIDDILKEFKKDSFIDYKAKNDDFMSLHESLLKYKEKKKAKYSNKSVAIDINNYLHILELREKAKGSTILDISDYFITADENLCDWGKEVFPGVIPIAILPSVWHSLILKFTGRTNDDYKAFTQFLNLRYRVKSDDFDERKPRILFLVQSMDEPVEIKEMILRDINEKLTTEYKAINNIDDIIETSKKNVIQQEAEKIFDSKKVSIIDSSKVKGKIEAYYSIAEIKAIKKFRIYNTITKIFGREFKIVVGILFLIGMVVSLILWGLDGISEAFIKESYGFSIFTWVSVGLLILEILSFLLFRPIQEKLSQISFDTIKEKEYNKLISKYDNTK